MSDPASLSNLRDLALPPEVTPWPPAPGWWVVAAASAVIAAILIVMAVRHHRRNAYRREALRALDAAAPHDISTVLKRAALAAWPRAEVASLSGAAWLAFLDRTGRTTAFTSGAGRAIETLAFGGTAGDVDAVRGAARHWLRHHRWGRATPVARSSLASDEDARLESRAPST
jgi:Domain of unknown function (DUF4381)